MPELEVACVMQDGEQDKSTWWERRFTFRTSAQGQPDVPTFLEGCKDAILATGAPRPAELAWHVLANLRCADERQAGIKLRKAGRLSTMPALRTYTVI